MRKVMRTLVFAFILGAGLVMVRCTQDNTAPTKATVQLEMRATTTLSTLNPAGRTEATGLTFDSVMLGVTRMKFQTQDETHHESEMDSLHGMNSDDESDSLVSQFKGPFIVDLIKGTSTPDFGIATLLPGVFEQVKFKLGPVLPDGNSIFISFTYLPNGATTSVKVVYSTKARLKLEIKKKGGFNIDVASLHPILVTLDLDLLFSNIDLSSAVADTNGVVRINSNSNAALAELITRNLREGMKTGEDKNHDHHIDD